MAYNTTATPASYRATSTPVMNNLQTSRAIIQISIKISVVTTIRTSDDGTTCENETWPIKRRTLTRCVSCMVAPLLSVTYVRFTTMVPLAKRYRSSTPVAHATDGKQSFSFIHPTTFVRSTFVSVPTSQQSWNWLLSPPLPDDNLVACFVLILLYV